MTGQIYLSEGFGPGGVAESGDYRASLKPDTWGRALMACQVHDGSGWRNILTGTTSLVEGLDLIVTQYNSRGGELLMRGTFEIATADDGQPVSGSGSVLDLWEGRVYAVPGGWLGIEVELDLPDAAVARPELILWLGDIVTMHERQTYTFRQTLLSGPTVNCMNLGGNDLPIVYFYDPRTRIETAVYVPATHLTWTARRFLDYRCDLQLDRATPRYGVGLVSGSATNTLVEGPHRFAWYVRQRTRDTAPGEWETQRELVDAIGQFIPATAAPPVAWDALSSGALQELVNEPAAQITVQGYAGHPAYIRDSSQVRAEDRRPTRLELMTQADILPPLALYLKLHPDAKAEEHLRKLIATLPLFHLPDLHWVGNVFPSAPMPIEDIWYFLENALIKLPWVAAITGDEQLWSMFLDAVVGAREMAHRVHHVFPLFVDVATRQPAASATNYSVGGMYAYGQMLAYAHTREIDHLEEARITLATLERLTMDRMWHEPQQLGFAAAAAALLAEEGNDVAGTWAQNLLAAQLRMVYWDDHSPAGDALTGMFQACASLLYPAFKENVESILPWPHLLRANLGDPTILLRLLDAQRRHNSAFFDLLREDTSGPGHCIPFENLGTVELPEEGRLGKELYGTGEVFWLYLLLEALGRPDDAEILMLSLDLPMLSALTQFPPASRSFMVFNPTSVHRNTMITIPALPDGAYTVHGASEYRAATIDGCLRLGISLDPGEVQRLDFAPAQAL